MKRIKHATPRRVGADVSCADLTEDGVACLCGKERASDKAACPINTNVKDNVSADLLVECAE